MSDWEIQTHFKEKNAESMLPGGRRVMLKRKSGGHKSAYFTVEVYPEHRPRRPARHFGTWQFQIDDLGDDCELSVAIDAEGARVERGGSPLSPTSVIKGKLREDGLYRIYLVLAEKDTYDKLAVTEYFQLVSFSGAKLDPLNYWPGTGQRKPTLRHPEYLKMISLLDLLGRFAEEIKPDASASVLDFGCGFKPYYPLFAQSGCRYVGADIFDGQFVDVVCNMDKPLELQDEQFDAVLCTQVLEHVAEPAEVVAGFERVLKKGGKAFVSLPFAWEEHNYPADYWRFARGGIRHLFRNFSDVQIIANGNSSQCMIILGNLCFHRRFKTAFIRDTLIRLRNYYGLTIAARSADDNMPCNFVVIATK